MQAARLRLERGRAHRETPAGVTKEQGEQADDRERDSDHAEVLDRERDAADPDRTRRERRPQRLLLRPPQEAGQRVERDEEADRDDRARHLRLPLERPHDDPLHEQAEHERAEEREGGRRPVREAVLHDEPPADEGHEGAELAVREADDAGRAIDEHDRQRERRVDPAVGEAAHHLLPELRHQAAAISPPRYARITAGSR